MNIRHEYSPYLPLRWLVFAQSRALRFFENPQLQKGRTMLSNKTSFHPMHSQNRSRHGIALRRCLALVIAASLLSSARADNPDEVVRWTASLNSASTITRGSAATLDLSGEIQDGWHVYALEQHSGGPTPLRVTLDTNAVATLTGPTSGTAPEKVHDAHFGFETQLYTHPFVVHLPVRVGRELVPGRQLIPVSVRFQACSDRECLLPRTVHLSVPVEVSAPVRDR